MKVMRLTTCGSRLQSASAFSLHSQMQMLDGRHDLSLKKRLVSSLYIVHIVHINISQWFCSQEMLRGPSMVLILKENIQKHCINVCI